MASFTSWLFFPNFVPISQRPTPRDNQILLVYYVLYVPHTNNADPSNLIRWSHLLRLFNLLKYFINKIECLLLSKIHPEISRPLSIKVLFQNKEFGDTYFKLVTDWLS